MHIFKSRTRSAMLPFKLILSVFDIICFIVCEQIGYPKNKVNIWGIIIHKRKEAFKLKLQLMTSSHSIPTYENPYKLVIDTDHAYSVPTSLQACH